MPTNCQDPDELKRKVRKLKKLEMKIRFGQEALADERTRQRKLVWDEFFDLSEVGIRQAKYSLGSLVSMTRDDYKNVVSEFFFAVYYRFYKENGIVSANLYNPEILAHMDLPPDADMAAIKKRFRELAKKYHPDTGGDSARFIELMEDYKKLVDQ